MSEENNSKFFLTSKGILGGLVALAPFITDLAGEPALREYAPEIAAIGGILAIVGRLFASKKHTLAPKKKPVND